MYYDVEIRKSVTISVEADNPEEAEELARDAADSTTIEWEMDDNIEIDVYEEAYLKPYQDIMVDKEGEVHKS